MNRTTTAIVACLAVSLAALGGFLWLRSGSIQTIGVAFTVITRDADGFDHQRSAYIGSDGFRYDAFSPPDPPPDDDVFVESIP